MISLFLHIATGITFLTSPMLTMPQKASIPVVHEMPLSDRYPVESVNEVFKKNILLTMAYLSGTVKSARDVDWKKVTTPFTYEFKLNPGEVFSFHDIEMAEFAKKTVQTTHSHFSASEGYISDGFLFGDGVCHLASLMNWAAQDAGLEVVAPTNHNFANIPDIPKEYGTSIYVQPNEISTSQQQNLYIKNNFSAPVIFRFQYDGKNVSLSIEKEII